MHYAFVEDYALCIEHYTFVEDYALCIEHYAFVEDYAFKEEKGYAGSLRRSMNSMVFDSMEFMMRLTRDTR